MKTPHPLVSRISDLLKDQQIRSDVLTHLSSLNYEANRKTNLKELPQTRRKYFLQKSKAASHISPFITISFEYVVREVLQSLRLVAFFSQPVITYFCRDALGLTTKEQSERMLMQFFETLLFICKRSRVKYVYFDSFSSVTPMVLLRAALLCSIEFQPVIRDVKVHQIRKSALDAKPTFCLFCAITLYCWILLCNNCFLCVKKHTNTECPRCKRRALRRVRPGLRASPKRSSKSFTRGALYHSKSSNLLDCES